MRPLFFAFQVLIALPVLTGCTKQSADQAASPVDGDWIIVSMKHHGGETTPEEVEGMKWQVGDNVISATDPDGSTGRMTVKLDTERKWIDITALEGGNRVGETDQGIYTLDHEKLTICLAEPTPGAKRPQEIAVNSEAWILELQRARR